MIYVPSDHRVSIFDPSPSLSPSNLCHRMFCVLPKLPPSLCLSPPSPSNHAVCSLNFSLTLLLSLQHKTSSFTYLCTSRGSPINIPSLLHPVSILCPFPQTLQLYTSAPVKKPIKIICFVSTCQKAAKVKNKNLSQPVRASWVIKHVLMLSQSYASFPETWVCQCLMTMLMSQSDHNYWVSKTFKTTSLYMQITWLCVMTVCSQKKASQIPEIAEIVWWQKRHHVMVT